MGIMAGIGAAVAERNPAPRRQIGNVDSDQRGSTRTSAEQSRKASVPTLVTLYGIVTDASPEQPENALATMVVEPCETTALVMEE